MRVVRLWFKGTLYRGYCYGVVMRGCHLKLWGCMNEIIHGVVTRGCEVLSDCWSNGVIPKECL